MPGLFGKKDKDIKDSKKDKKKGKKKEEKDDLSWIDKLELLDAVLDDEE